MNNYHVCSHEVAAVRIVNLQPLLGRNEQLVSPESGLVLVLEDETKHKWLCEKDSVTPTVGDFLVTDKELNVTYIVTAAKFATLFQENKTLTAVATVKE
jgi:hypothetical protein